jgi:hypothetical protein
VTRYLTESKGARDKKKGEPEGSPWSDGLSIE